MAVRDVNLRVEAGEILALLGPNGAGKTTAIRMLASILRPTRGRATVAGFDVVSQARQVRHIVGMLTEHHGLYTRMQARQYLEFFASAYGISSAEASRRSTELLEQHELGGYTQQRLGTFSKGMRQKLALARALIHDPLVLLLDEPTSAMDPASSRLVREIILSLRSHDRAIIVCTHNLHEAEQLADRIAIISQSRIISQGTIAELKREMLGDPIMDLRLAGPLQDVLGFLPSDLAPVEFGENWMRYRAPEPETLNPQVLQAASRAGVPIVTLSEVGRSLEEIYLNVVSSGREWGGDVDESD